MTISLGCCTFRYYNICQDCLIYGLLFIPPKVEIGVELVYVRMREDWGMCKERGCDKSGGWGWVVTSKI